MTTFRSASSVEEAHSVLFPLAESEGWERAVSTAEVAYQTTPAGVILAISPENEILGLCTTHIYENETGFLGPFALKEEARGKGIGGQLFKAGLDHLDRSCKTVGLTSVIAQKGTYERRGFKQYGDSPFYSRQPIKSLPLTVSKSNAWTIVDIKSDSVSVNDLIAIDYTATGMKRSALIKNIYDHSATKGWAITSSDNSVSVAAYLFARPTTLGYTLGPIYAQSVSMAKTLIVHALKSLPDEATITLDGWSRNKDSLELLAELGFKQTGNYHYMWRGPEPEPMKEGGIASKIMYSLADACFG